MRVYLHLTQNTEPVPYDYQSSLVGAFHKWLGPNEIHDDISLYSLSWLSHGVAGKNGLDFPNGSTFYVSAPHRDLLKKMIDGIFQGQDIRWGMKVREVVLQPTPEFGDNRRFLVQSPVLIKRNRVDGDGQQYFFPYDKESNGYLTETMQHKLTKAGLSHDIEVMFDPEYQNPKTKKIQYNKIDIIGTLCPIIVKGDPEAVSFAWNVGVGNSTGIGFGAVR